MSREIAACFWLALFSACLGACMMQEVAAPAPKAPAHHHQPPRGGALVVLGAELAHLELLANPHEGALSLYVMDGEALRGVRLAQEQVTLTISPPRGEAFTITLAARANALTGETVGDTSEFAATDERLKGLNTFAAQLSEIQVMGQTFQQIDIRYPQGNH